MRKRVWLPQDVLNGLCEYGWLNEVVNTLLVNTLGEYPLSYCPGNREGDSLSTIAVWDSTERLLTDRGNSYTNPRWSLRGFLCYYVYSGKIREAMAETTPYNERILATDALNSLKEFNDWGTKSVTPLQRATIARAITVLEEIINAQGNNS